MITAITVNAALQVRPSFTFSRSLFPQLMLRLGGFTQTGRRFITALKLRTLTEPCDTYSQHLWTCYGRKDVKRE